MKIVTVSGVPCAVANNDPDNDVFAGFGPDNCVLCPLANIGLDCGAVCAKHEIDKLTGPYIELKYVPIMQMRGVKFI